MKERILTSNSEEVISVKWDGVRFAIVKVDRVKSTSIVLNPVEMLAVIEFAGNLGVL